MLVVEQNATRALRLADRGYLLRSGRVVTTGTGSELAADTGSSIRSSATRRRT